MSEEILIRAEEYLARRRHRMRMLRAFTAMALVVAIMTSYILMLPGLTLQSEAYCGYSEHNHDSSCYTMELICAEQEREAREEILELLECTFRPHGELLAPSFGRLLQQRGQPGLYAGQQSEASPHRRVLRDGDGPFLWYGRV